MRHDYLAAYREAFSHPEYSKSSPSEDFVKSDTFAALIQQYDLKPTNTHFIEYGAGCGRALKRLHDMGYPVTGVDIDNFMEDKSIPFIQQNLCSKSEVQLELISMDGFHKDHVDVGLCIDVMEHIEESDARCALVTMMTTCKALYLQIACFDDVMTDQLGLSHKMHINVKDGVWWGEKIDALALELGKHVRWAFSRNEGYFKCLVTD
jgi:hypothetical protein